MKITVDTKDNYIHAQIEDQDVTESDLEGFRTAIKDYTDDTGHAPNLMIETARAPHFPSFQALRKQAEFAYGQSKHIKKVAIVTDSMLGDFIPQIANLFVKADIKHFKMDQQQAATDWLTTKEKADASS